MLGDFNKVLHVNERQSLRDRLDLELEKFRSTFEQVNLVEMHTRGRTITWSNGPVGD